MQWCLYIWFYEDNHIIYKITNNRLKYKFKNTTFVKIIYTTLLEDASGKVVNIFFQPSHTSIAPSAYYRYAVLHITVIKYLFMPI